MQNPTQLCALLAALAALTCAPTAQAQTWQVQFLRPLSNETTITMHTLTEAEVLVSGLNRADLLASGDRFRIRADNEKLLHVERDFNGTEVDAATGTVRIAFPMEALFLGLTHVYVERVRADGAAVERAAQTLAIIIVREVRVIDHVFTGSVATLVSLLYINFGAALSLGNLKGIVRRPIGPAIGFFGQFLIMPLVSGHIFYQQLFG